MARVLVSAYACEPHSGSEPGVGWHWARQAALHGHEVHVVTRANNRNVIEGQMEIEPVAGLEFHYLDLPPLFQALKRRSGTIGLVAYYYLWQLALARRARLLHRRHRFDILHHVTFANDWLPTGLVFVPRVPLVWGPIGGSTHRAPPDIERQWPGRDRRYERVRSLLQRAFLNLDPLVRWTRRRAVAVLPYTREAMEGLPPAVASKSRVVTHIGVDGVRATPSRGEGDTLTIVTGGRLVHWKGIDLVIEGLARHLDRRPGSARLLITGSGPWEGRLTDLTRHLRIDHAVEFVGRLPDQRDVLDLVSRADLYALPTWRDGPPVAILEAMSVATAIMCLDTGATAELVPPEAGILIAPSGRDHVVDDIGRALTWSCDHPARLEAMGQAAAAVAAERHSWTAIGRMIDEVYRSVINGK